MTTGKWPVTGGQKRRGPPTAAGMTPYPTMWDMRVTSRDCQRLSAKCQMLSARCSKASRIATRNSAAGGGRGFLGSCGRRWIGDAIDELFG